MSDQERIDDKPDPARVAIDKPHLSAEELEHEVGNAEPWDEASEKDFLQDSDADSEDSLD